jgi:uncharacterized protein
MPEDSGPDARTIEIAHHCFDLARAGETDAVIAYVEAGVPADLTDAKGNTLVMLAAYHGNADTVAALLERGADPDRANDRGQTPLSGAVFKVEEATIRALVAGGADPDAGTPSARESAVFLGRDELLALLDGD